MKGVRKVVKASDENVDIGRVSNFTKGISRVERRGER